jgi:glutamyl-tRNA reductase
VQPSLVIIGLNYRTASLDVRERFWISESRRYEAIHQLVRSEGIDEAVVLSTPYRTEFILWASDASSAANSVLRLLTREYDLKMCEWSSFYRLLDEAALTHLFRLASGLDTVAIGTSAIVPFLNSAFEQARTAGTLGRFLQAVLDEAHATSNAVQALMKASTCTVSMGSGVVGLVGQALGSVKG